MFQRSDSPLPFCDRKIDALLHQVFVAPVLMTGRGPMANGIPVPAYTSDLTAALNLIEIDAPGREWGVERISGRINVWIAARTDLPYVRIVLEDHSEMPPASAVIAAMVESANHDSDRLTKSGVSQPTTMVRLAERAHVTDCPFGERVSLNEALRAPEAALESAEAV